MIQILSDYVNYLWWNFTASSLSKIVRSLQIGNKRVRKFGIKACFPMCCGFIFRQIHYPSMKIIVFTTFSYGNFTLIWYFYNRFIFELTLSTFFLFLS